jgi:mitogen-activated protein kinase 1/3
VRQLLHFFGIITFLQALAHPYFKGLAKVEREPSCQPITKMEFEFERRRVTKEDIRELIFREILEYHQQLLKDYINGTERTTFLYPSAVDQFRKQFAHLEENSGNGPVIPMERKHTSLPRSTIVHSAPIPVKEQPRICPSREKHSSDESYKNPRETEKYSGNVPRTSQAPQRVPTARPGRVVGPVMPYENGSTKDPYDARRLSMNSGYPPQQQIPQTYGYYQTPGKLACSEPSQAERYTLHQQAYSTTVPDVALDMRAPPFHHLSAGPKSDSSDRLTADTNLYSRSLNGIAATAAGVAASAHRKVGVVPFSMSRMY